MQSSLRWTPEWTRSAGRRAGRPRRSPQWPARRRPARVRMPWPCLAASQHVCNPQRNRVQPPCDRHRDRLNVCNYGTEASMTAASDRAVSQLRERILGGEYTPGERLAEVELAEKLGVSRTPVREALRRLAAEGLVDITTNKGARVVDYPRQDLERIFEIRARVEGLSARVAAELATTADIDRLDHIATVLKDHSDA